MGDGRFGRAGRVMVAASLAVSLCPVAQVSAFAEGQEARQADGADLELYANTDARWAFGTTSEHVSGLSTTTIAWSFVRLMARSPARLLRGAVAVMPRWLLGIDIRR